MSNLRRGDVVTQYSKSQILLLLASANYENCEKVIGRLRSKFFASYRGEPLTLLSALMPIHPASASK